MPLQKNTGAARHAGLRISTRVVRAALLAGTSHMRCGLFQSCTPASFAGGMFPKEQTDHTKKKRGAG